ncbi:hypothetical protein GCM10023143_16400 [Compostibacter hankyongensis]|uniref:Uncharacterized protein n=1 Tax=Compostibacter hankyongensis TaxID=1007089 RepID=A0ABP8FQQ0_9BACT
MTDALKTQEHNPGKTQDGRDAIPAVNFRQNRKMKRIIQCSDPDLSAVKQEKNRKRMFRQRQPDSGKRKGTSRWFA